MLNEHQSQIVTLTLAYRALAAYPAAYCIRKSTEHQFMCLLEKRGLVTYSGDNVPDNGWSTWTATDVLRNRMTDLLSGKDVSAAPIEQDAPTRRFEAGDRVVVSNPLKGVAHRKDAIGRVVKLRYQENTNYVVPGFLVEFEDGESIYFYDHELAPAPEVHEHPYPVGTRIRVASGFEKFVKDTYDVSPTITEGTECIITGYISPFRSIRGKYLCDSADGEYRQFTLPEQFTNLINKD